MSISPNVPSPQESYHYENVGTPRWIIALFVVLIVGLAALAYAGYSIRTRFDQELAKAEEQNKILTAQLEQANTRIADLKGQADVTSQKVGMTQAELAQAKSRAESIRKEQLASDQKLTEQITTAQKESAAQIGAVATDVKATKSKLERATGDMGVMSGLIAKNHDDLEELKRRGDRNYYEFTIQKAKTPQRVGPVQIALNKTDQKKSKYTMTVLADDKSIEKKDKTSGEPVQFYVKGSAKLTPYEVVVFDVGKNQITGYLATPKDATGASTSK